MVHFPRVTQDSRSRNKIQFRARGTTAQSYPNPMLYVALIMWNWPFHKLDKHTVQLAKWVRVNAGYRLPNPNQILQTGQYACRVCEMASFTKQV